MNYDKAVPVQAKKAHGGSRGTAPLILNHDMTQLEGSFTKYDIPRKRFKRATVEYSVTQEAVTISASYVSCCETVATQLLGHHGTQPETRIIM